MRSKGHSVANISPIIDTGKRQLGERGVKILSPYHPFLDQENYGI